MTDEKPIVCVKCGAPVVVHDGDALVMDEGRRFTAYCSTMGRLHGFVEGSTEEAALTAYAKDQEWGMKRIEKLEWQIAQYEIAHWLRNGINPAHKMSVTEDS